MHDDPLQRVTKGGVHARRGRISHHQTGVEKIMIADFDAEMAHHAVFDRDATVSFERIDRPDGLEIAGHNALNYVANRDVSHVFVFG